MGIASELEKLVVRITADAKQYHDQMKGVISKAEAVGKKMTAIGKKMTVAFTLPLAAAATVAVKMASDAEEIESKFNTVFTGVQREAKAAAQELRKSYGLAASESQKLLGDTGDLLSGFGFSKKAALDMSLQVQKLSVDLASFQNLEGGSARASRILSKALVGNKGALDELGIVANETSDRWKELVKDFKENKGMTEAQAKAQTVLTMAMEQSKNSIGDYARTRQSFANQSREMMADIKEQAVAFGKILLPAAKAIIAEVKKLTKWIGSLSETQKKWIVIIGAAVAAIGPLLMIVGSLATGLGALTKAFAYAKAAVMAFGGAIGVAKIALVAFTGYIAYRLTSALTGANKLYKKLNDEIERGQKLQEKSMARMDKQFNGRMEEINQIKDTKTKQEELRKSLKWYTKELEGYKNQIGHAGKEVKRLDALWGSSLGRASKLRKVAAQTLTDFESKADSTRDKIQAIRDQLVGLQKEQEAKVAKEKTDAKKQLVDMVMNAKQLVEKNPLFNKVKTVNRLKRTVGSGFKSLMKGQSNMIKGGAKALGDFFRSPEVKKPVKTFAERLARAKKKMEEPIRPTIDESGLTGTAAGTAAAITRLAAYREALQGTQKTPEQQAVGNVRQGIGKAAQMAVSLINGNSDPLKDVLTKLNQNLINPAVKLVKAELDP